MQNYFPIFFTSCRKSFPAAQTTPKSTASKQNTLSVSCSVGNAIHCAWSFQAAEKLGSPACPPLPTSLSFFCVEHLFRQFQHLGKAQRVLISL